jgi:hypothetical protein
MQELNERARDEILRHRNGGGIFFLKKKDKNILLSLVYVCVLIAGYMYVCGAACRMCQRAYTMQRPSYEDTYMQLPSYEDTYTGVQLRMPDVSTSIQLLLQRPAILLSPYCILLLYRWARDLLSRSAWPMCQRAYY